MRDGTRGGGGWGREKGHARGESKRAIEGSREGWNAKETEREREGREGGRERTIENDTERKRQGLSDQRLVRFSQHRQEQHRGKKSLIALKCLHLSLQPLL